MTAVLRKLESGARVFVHPCDECGAENAPFGFRRAGDPSRWYCSAHRALGEAFLAGRKGGDLFGGAP